MLRNIAAVSAKALGDATGAELHWRAAIASQPRWPDPHINLGNLLAEVRRYEEAEAAYRAVLEFLPGSAEAHNGLGTLLQATGRIAEAEAAYRMALKHQPKFAEVLVNLGVLLHATQRFAEAEDCYNQALRIRQEFAEAHIGMASLFRAMQRVDESVAAYRRALAIRPESVNIYINLGSLLQESKRLQEAELAYHGALALDPGSLAAYNNLAMILKDTKRLEDAERSCRRALAIWPDYADAYNNLGLVLNQTKRFEEAEAAFRQSLHYQPESVVAYNNLGTLLIATKRYEEAEAVYRKALAIRPDFAAGLNNLGNIQMGLQRLYEAECSFQRAVRIDPLHFDAFNNLGSVLQDLKRFDAAEAAFRQMVRLKGVDGNASGQAYLCARSLCAWDSKAEDETLLADMVHRGVSDIPVFNLLSIANPAHSSAPVFQLRAARLYAQGKYFELSLPALVDPASHPRRDRLRIGYLSADFHEHATMYLLHGVLAAHDRSRFALHGYSYGPTTDAVTMKARESFEVFRDLKGLAGSAAATLIAADGIDILVDLKGYTANARLEITSLRPAPVIVSWLGYPGTLGHPRLADYIIGDPTVTPPEHAAHFSETLALMPHCYQPNDRQRAVGRMPSRAEAGLPEQGLVFCSFNQSYKFDPDTFGIWCRLLDEVPGSVLWLLTAPAPAVANLQREAQARGIAPERVIFAPVKHMTEHLGRLQLADLALDTFPVTSHTTASDALWAGVPLVTRIGDSFVSRVPASLLNTLGLPELVTRDQQAYYALARALALDPLRLAEIRQRLNERRLSSPLFDTLRFARDLEALYTRIWEQHATGTRELIAS